MRLANGWVLLVPIQSCLTLLDIAIPGLVTEWVASPHSWPSPEGGGQIE